MQLTSDALPEACPGRGLGVALKLIYFRNDFGVEKGFLMRFLSFFWWANNYIYNSTRQGWSLTIDYSLRGIWMWGQVLGMKICASSFFVAVEKQGIRWFCWSFSGGHFGLENQGHEPTSLVQSGTNTLEGTSSVDSSENWRMFGPDHAERKIDKQIGSYMMIIHSICNEGRNLGKLGRFWGKVDIG